MTAVANSVISKILLFLLKLFGSIPKILNPLVSSSLLGAMRIFGRKEVRRIQSNLERVYGIPAHSVFSKTMAIQVLRHQSKAFLETLQQTVSDGIEIEGLEELQVAMQESLKQGDGVVVVTGHVGSWELVAHYGAVVAGGNFNALAKPARFNTLTQFLEDMRQSSKVRVLWNNKRSILRDMFQALKSNEPLGFVMDQKPESRVGHMVNFLNQETMFVAGPARIALKTGAPVLGIYCVRVGNLKYRLICDKILYNSDASEMELTQRMAASIGRVVQSYPEQWLWNYRRW